VQDQSDLVARFVLGCGVNVGDRGIVS
jgi:hypothetical protein